MISKRLRFVRLRVGQYAASGRQILVPVRGLKGDLTMNPLALVVTWIAAWVNRYQQVVIEYLQEEVRVLQGRLGGMLSYYYYAPA